MCRIRYEPTYIKRYGRASDLSCCEGSLADLYE